MNYYISQAAQQKLLDDRIIFIDDAITPELTNRVVSELLFLEAQDSKKTITLYINSPGGSVRDGFAIIDTMNFISCDVATIGIGEVASMASLILASGTKGKRYLLPSTRCLIHQIMSGIASGSQFTDMQITLKETEVLKNLVNDCLANATGKESASIEKDTDRDYWMSASEAKNYGLIDKVITNRNSVY